MANIDTDHAIFVREAYRYEEVSEPAIKARNKGAQKLTIETQLGQSAAAALARKYLAENQQPRTFEVEFEGTADFADFIGAPPAYIVNSERLVTDGRTSRTFSQTVDYTKGITVVQVRG